MKMNGLRISAFTIVRNGAEFDYPFLESIKSILPIVDEFIINIGISNDGTKDKIQKMILSLDVKQAQKFKCFDSEWPLNDPEKRKGGKILSEQTNLALNKCTGDWCIYIQADEVVHEDDHEKLLSDIQTSNSNQFIDALVFQYIHFYGNYDVYQTSRSSYRREIRAIRNHKGIRSVGDAQGFRYHDGSKIRAKLTQTRIFHYGWVRHQEIMKQKTGFMDTLYHPDADAKLPVTGTNYQYKRIVGLKPFKGTHPKVMIERVRGARSFDFSKSPKVFHYKDTWKVVSGWFETLTGIRLFEYKNYKLIK